MSTWGPCGLRPWIISGIMCCVVGVSGCMARRHQPLFVPTLDPRSSESITAFHGATLPSDHKDYALHELIRARVFLDAGDYLDADACLSNACEVMERIVGDESRERLAVAWTESSKVFKGQPYERALAWFYRGICHYQMEDYAGALAAFRHSLACDQETRSNKQEDLEDFSISHFMAARAYQQLDEPSNARAALAAARRYAGDSPHLLDSGLEANCVIIIESGMGPFIRPSGLDASIATVGCPNSPDVRVSVSVDGQSVGDATTVTDLLAQAKSQGWGEMDSVRLGKSIGRQVVSHLPYAGLAANLIRSEVDTRCWHNAPQLFHVFVGDVSPGLHTIGITVRNATGQPEPRYGQTWHHILFPAERETLLLLRSVRNAQNQYNLVPADLSGRALQPVASAKNGS